MSMPQIVNVAVEMFGHWIDLTMLFMVATTALLAAASAFRRMSYNETMVLTVAFILFCIMHFAAVMDHYGASQNLRRMLDEHKDATEATKALVRSLVFSHGRVGVMAFYGFSVFLALGALWAINTNQSRNAALRKEKDKNEGANHR